MLTLSFAGVGESRAGPRSEILALDREGVMERTPFMDLDLAHFFTGLPTFRSTEATAAVNRPVRSA